MTKNKKKLADLKGLRDWDATEINMVLQIKDVTEFIEQHWDNLKEGFPSNLVYIKRKGNKIEIYPAALKTLENSEIDGNMGEIGCKCRCPVSSRDSCFCACNSTFTCC